MIVVIEPLELNILWLADKFASTIVLDFLN